MDGGHSKCNRPGTVRAHRWRSPTGEKQLAQSTVHHEDEKEKGKKKHRTGYSGHLLPIKGTRQSTKLARSCRFADVELGAWADAMRRPPRPAVIQSVLAGYINQQTGPTAESRRGTRKTPHNPKLKTRRKRKECNHDNNQESQARPFKRLEHILGGKQGSLW
ncbi:hypothetical protein IF2G_08720 [Cordyceps javanica]|nr:hypothetical protein IF2G_08720 [Cordyceps javanica]